MNIRIGKTDVASLGCEGCKKKFVCNIANNSSADKTEVETDKVIRLRAYV